MSEGLDNVLRIVIGGVLLTAGLAKWRLGPAAFGVAIQGYRILPRAFPQMAARVIVAMETAIGVALIVGVGSGVAAVVGAVLLIAFASAMAVSLARGDAADCGCAGFVGHQRIGWRLVYRNLVLSAALAPVAAMSGAGPLLVSLVGGASLALALVHLGTGVVRVSMQPKIVGGDSR